MTAAKIKGELKSLYGASAYLCDGFKEVTGNKAIERYFCREMKAVREFTVSFHDVSSHDGEHYFRWTMRFKLKFPGFKNAAREGVSQRQL